MIGRIEAGAKEYYVKDHLGSTRTVVNTSGSAVSYFDYYPFGKLMAGRHTWTNDDRYKFTGHERDEEAGLTLDYMMARNYDPEIGRFLQIDPLADQFAGWSPYNYGLNNPLKYIDPTGMAAEEAGDCPKCIESLSNILADIKATWDSFKEGVTEYVFDKNTQVAEQTSHTKAPNEKNLIKNAGYQTTNVVDNTYVLPYVSVSVSKAESYGPDWLPVFGTATSTPYGTYLTGGGDGTGGLGLVPISVSGGLILKHGGPVLPSDLSGWSAGTTAGVGIGFETATSLPLNTVQVGVVLSPNMWIGANSGYTFRSPIQNY